MGNLRPLYHWDRGGWPRKIKSNISLPRVTIRSEKNERTGRIESEMEREVVRNRPPPTYPAALSLSLLGVLFAT